MAEKLTVTVERRSVCAADDSGAPHEMILSFDSAISVADALKKIRALDYFPRIQGGKGTWLAVGKKPLAVLAEEWSKPRLIVDSSAKLADHLAEEGKILFHYLAQESPDVAFTREKKTA